MTDFVILDFETNGLNPRDSEIIEIGALITDGNEIIEEFQSLVKPENEIPTEIENLTGITNDMVADAPELEEPGSKLIEFIGDRTIVSHNSSMEAGFLNQWISPLADGRVFEVEDSIEALGIALPHRSQYSLSSLRKWAEIDGPQSHRAMGDCRDLFEVLKKAREAVRSERPWTSEIVRDCHPDWWWKWFFQDGDEGKSFEFSAERMSTFYLENLPELQPSDESQSELVIEAKAKDLLEERAEQEGLEIRSGQVSMAGKIESAISNEEPLVIEAPTGIGKSMAYLLGGYLEAKKKGERLVVSTHSRSLQDQLVDKDIPKLARLLQTDVSSAVVKGQANYLCLRKLQEEIETLDDSKATSDDSWAITYLQTLVASSHSIDIGRISRMLRKRFPLLDKILEQSRSHFSTTVGPKCPFYKRCHFFNSARIAKSSDVIVSNHALTFQWPAHLPEIKNLVFDEAHHLENQITDAFSLRLSSEDFESTFKTLKKNHRSRPINDLSTMAGYMAAIGLETDDEDKNHKEELVTIVEDLVSLSEEFFRRVVDTGELFGLKNAFNPILVFDEIKKQESRTYPLIECLKEMGTNISKMIDRLKAALEVAEKQGRRKDHHTDLLSNYLERLIQYSTVIEHTMQVDNDNELRQLSFSTRRERWDLVVQPIDVSEHGKQLFEEQRSVVLTSATLSVPNQENFITKRLGLETEGPMTRLASPFRLEETAEIFIPKGIPIPGRQEHFDALMDFVTEAAKRTGGRMLVLISSNLRVRMAVNVLSERLRPHGISVIDSLTDSHASETLKAQPRTVVIGSEKYGEGIDIPGDALSFVVLEKINESMTRGPLAEARKSRTRFALFDYDFPLRMIWLRQRVGRLIRSQMDEGMIVLFDSRFERWSRNSQNIVRQAVDPIPIDLVEPDDILDRMSAFSERFNMSETLGDVVYPESESHGPSQ